MMKYSLIKSIINSDLNNDDKILNLFYNLLPKTQMLIFSTLSAEKYITCKEISEIVKLPTKDISSHINQMIKVNSSLIIFKIEKNKKYYMLNTK